MTDKDKGGRPTDYNDELAVDICNHIAGGKSLRSFCRGESAPHMSTVCRWIIKHDKFRDQYAHAREAAGYAHADGIIEIVELLRDEGVEPQIAKVMMDGLKWAAERMAPKAHSSSQKIDHTSSDNSMTPKSESLAVIEALKAKHESK